MERPALWRAGAALQLRGPARFTLCSCCSCLHLSDIFDDRADAAWRADFWQLVRDTPTLTWLVLTKRPQNIAGMLPLWWAGASFWMKQTGSNRTDRPGITGKGRDIAEWPADLRVQELSENFIT